MRFTKQQTETLAAFEERCGELGFDGLSPYERHCEALLALEGDVMNGGLSQYFFNSSGDLAPVALEALAELGAWKTHAALDSAIKKIWPDAYPEQRSERYDSLLRAEEEDESLLDSETNVIQELPEDFLYCRTRRVENTCSP